MDQHSCYHPFNHQQHPPASELPPYYAPSSPSDFIYNSANATASIFRPSPPSHPSLFSVLNESASTLTYPSGGMGYGPSRPVEQSFPTYLPSLPEPTPGLAEHRRQRQRQTTMTMGPGPSKLVPPPLPLGSEGGSNRGSNRGSNSSSNESTVVIKQEEVSSSPVLVSMPMVKKWEPRMPRMPTEGPGQQIKVDGKGKGKGKERLFDPFGNAGLENGIGGGRGSGSGIGSGTWEERGEGVMERVVIPPMVPSIGMGMETGMERDMGMGMEPTIMPKMGLFKPIRWDGPSSSSASRSSKARARRARAWEAFEDGDDVHPQRTYGNQNENGSRNRNNNEETEDEQPDNAPISFPSHSRSSKRLKTPLSGFAFRSASASAETETAATVKIKQEPGLSPSPSAVFAKIPMYSDSIANNNGYDESSGHDNPPSSRSISPMTRVRIPRRLLFPTPNRTSTGTNSQLSLRGMSKQLKKRHRQMGLDREQSRERSREESREQSREQSRERRGEGFWSLAGGSGSQAQGRNTTAAQDEEIGEWTSPRQQQQQQQQQQYRGSSEEKEEGWTTISGSSEEGEVSSHYENSYSCGQERDDDGAPGEPHQSSPFLPYTDQEWCHPFSSSPASPAPVPGSSSSARYGPGSVPSLSASQLREEQYRQAIQMVQDTCLEASKRYIRAHCVNRGARGGGSPDTSTLSHETAETRSARKVRRKRKLKSRHASSSSSSSGSTSSSPSPSPSSRQRQRRRGKGKRRNRTKKRITTTPPSSPSSSQFHDSITCTSSLLPNISQICTLLWSRSQSLRLHDIDSIELHTARNMYWLLSWAETVAFTVPVPPTPLSATNGRTSNTSASSSSFFGVFPGVPSLEDLGARGRRDTEHAPSCGDVLNGAGGYMWRERRDSEEEEEEEEGLGGIEVLESKNGAVCWSQQWDEMWMRVFEEGGMLCEFLGYGEGVERLGRVREFYGF